MEKMFVGIIAFLFAILIPIYLAWIFSLLFLKPGKYPRLTDYPSLSVIVPAHDEEEFIKETLDGVFGNEYPGELEVIVVNDGSRDSTGKILSEYSVGESRLAVLETNHLGKASAINTAAENASGEVLLALDADSVLASGALEKMVLPFQNPKVAGTSGIIRARMNSNLLTWFQDYEYLLTSAWRHVFHRLKSTYILPGFAAFRRSAFREVGGFRTDTLSEDFEIGLRLQKAGYSLEMTDALIHTNVPQTFRLLARQRIRWGRGTIQVIRKHKSMLFSSRFAAIGWLGIPTQLYWIIHGLFNLPYTFYQVFRGYELYFASKGQWLSLGAGKYFFGWISTYGFLEYSYNVFTGAWPAGENFHLHLLVFSLSTFYALLALISMSGRVSLRNLFSVFFFFPFSLFVLAMYCIPVFQELFCRESGHVNLWEKK